MAKKRANGEGNIRKRKDGRWEGRYTAGYDAKTGKRIIKNVLGKTQAEVKEKLKKALEECQGLDVSKAADEYTVATWLRTWYELYAKPNVRTATANRYELIIEHLHHPPHWEHQAEEADHPAPAEALQRVIGERQNTHRKEPEQRAQHHHRPQRPPDAPRRPGPGGEGAAHPPKPLRGLHCPQAPKAGHEDPAPGAHESLSGGRGAPRPAPHVLSGTGQRPAEGRTGGPAVGRRGHPEAKPSRSANSMSATRTAPWSSPGPKRKTPSAWCPSHRQRWTC